MKIVSVQFDYPGDKKYDILSRVLEYSVKKNCPEADFVLHKIDAPTKWRTKKCFASNTVKLQYWVDELEATDDDVVMLDCDMVVLRDIGDAFKLGDYDIALTVNGTGELPYNGGAVFARNTKAAKDFINLWNECNKELYEDTQKHLRWRNKYAGMNQAALGYMIETNIIMSHETPPQGLRIKAYDSIVKIKKIPCSIWNVCKNDWRTMNDNMYILHVKSALRTAVFAKNINSVSAQYAKAANIWRALAIDAGIMEQQIGVSYALPEYVTSYKTRNAQKRRQTKLQRRSSWHTRKG